MALVDMATDEKDWASAIAHYQQALLLQPLKETDQTHFKLGRLFLKNGDPQAARGSFVKSLSLSRAREKHLASIYRLFKKEGALNEFVGFYHDVQQRFALSAQSGILLARCFIDLKQYDQARRTLEELIADGETGFCCEPNSESIRKVIEVVMNDPARRVRVGAAARQFVVRECALESVWEREHAIMTGLVKGGGCP